MFTAQQYRAEAVKYDGFLAAAQSPAEIAEYRRLKQSYILHADNLDWLAANAGKTMSTEVRDPPRRKRRDRDGAYAEQENILRCLGTAVILNWNTIPTKLQRAIFEAASSIQDNDQAVPLKNALAKFLHDHKGDAPNQ
jgi:hypothetical protein